MFDFICIGSAVFLGTGWGGERKIQNENICLEQDSNPRPALDDRRSKPLGHDGLTMTCGFMSDRIMVYK